MAAMKALQTMLEDGESVRCSDYYGCMGCPGIETCEAFAETDECEEGG